MTPDDPPSAFKAPRGALPGVCKVIRFQGAHFRKVDARVFGILAGPRGHLAVKSADDETAERPIKIGAAGQAPHLPRGGWVALDLALTPGDTLHERPTTRYRTVRAALRQRLRPPL